MELAEAIAYQVFMHGSWSVTSHRPTALKHMERGCKVIPLNPPPVSYTEAEAAYAIRLLVAGGYVKQERADQAISIAHQLKEIQEDTPA